MFISSARSSIISISRSFFAIPNKLSGTALTAYSSASKMFDFKTNSRKTIHMLLQAAALPASKAIRMIGGLRSSGDVYSLDFISFKVRLIHHSFMRGMLIYNIQTIFELYKPVGIETPARSMCNLLSRSCCQEIVLQTDPSVPVFHLL